MLFNSIAYAVFFPMVFLLYWALPHKYRWVLLLGASYYFYMSWNPKYVVLILLTTVVSYVCSLLIERMSDKGKKKLVMAAGVLVSLAVLFFFKYFNFLSASLEAVLNSISIPLHPVILKVMLPVGISFYTFQTLSYIIDVYRGKLPAERHFGKYALYVSFFPQLVAGPIERSTNLLPQLKEEKHFDYDRSVHGILLMLWGFFKKIVIADSLAVYTDLAYNNVRDHVGLIFIIATVFFTVQIYCDFSGYSDIAIGSAKLMGIDLMTNFTSPFYVTSIKEHWVNWHISLSSWFRDYVYIPMGGSRVKKARHYFNTMVTFLLSGLWHGANWTYVLWGSMHGFYIVLGDFLRSHTRLPFFKNNKNARTEKISLGKRIHWWISVALTFLLIAATFIVFRSNTLSDALYVFTHLFTGITSPMSYVRDAYISLELGLSGLITLAAPIVVLFVYDYFSMKTDVIESIRRARPVLKWAVYWIMLLTVLYFAIGSTKQAFIYFQF